MGGACCKGCPNVSTGGSNRGPYADPFTFRQLTTRHRVAVALSWQYIMQNCPSCCVRIFIQYFKDQPQAKNLFSYRNLEGDDLIRDPTFTGHTVTFQRGLDTILRTVTGGDSDQVADDMVLELGMRHVQILGDNYTDLTSDLLEKFEKVILSTLKQQIGPENWTLETAHAWHFTLKLITGKMKEGFRMGCKAEVAKSKRMNVPGNVVANGDHFKQRVSAESVDSGKSA